MTRANDHEPVAELDADDRNAIWIVIAAFNEGPAVGDVVRDLKNRFPNVVVVDDGSSDETSEAAAEAGATVLRHVVNLGQGAALQTGIAFALRSGAEAIVTFDADGQHLSAEIPALARPVLKEGIDVALGSRFLGRAENIKKSKIATLKLAILFTFLTTGHWFTDVHNGFRCFSRSAASKIRIRHNQMAHASEILEQIVALKLKFREVPVTIVYTDYSMRKGQRISNSIRIVGDLFAGRIR